MAPIPGNNREEPEKESGEDNAVSALDAPQFLVQADSDSDDGQSDGEGTAYAGYQPLPQEPGGETNDTAVQDREEEEPAAASNSEAALDRLIMRSLNTQDLANASAPAPEGEPTREIPVEIAERKELWSSTKSPTENIKIDSEKADKIRAAMSGFKLPMSNVPEWAKVIPEDQWKTNLIDRLDKTPTATKESSSSHKTPEHSLPETSENKTKT